MFAAYSSITKTAPPSGGGTIPTTSIVPLLWYDCQDTSKMTFSGSNLTSISSIGSDTSIAVPATSSYNVQLGSINGHTALTLNAAGLKTSMASAMVGDSVSVFMQLGGLANVVSY